jgi:Restriction endonuclease
MPRIAEKPTLLRWLYRQEFDRPLQIREIVFSGAMQALGKALSDAEAYSETNSNSFWNYLFAHQDDQAKRGLFRAFEVLDATAKTMSWCGVGAAIPLQTLTSRERARLRHRPAMLRMIDDLTSRQYEALGCVVSRLGGASETLLTPKGNEGGVDFFALLPNPGRCHLFAGGIHPLRVVAQCKKHKAPVEEGDVRDFLHSLDSVRFRERKVEKFIPPWFQATRGPIVGLIVSHSGFQDAAERKARNHGVIVADTLDLAEIATQSRRVPETLNGDARAGLCKLEVTKLEESGVSTATVQYKFTLRPQVSEKV